MSRILPEIRGTGALSTIIQHRWMLRSFISREITNRYAGSVGGVVWALVHPLAMLAIFSVLFQTIFKVRFPELERFPFVAFMAMAMWPWLAFSEGLSRGTQAIVANSPLIKKVAFPHELVVYAAVGAAFAVQMAGYAFVLIMLAVLGYAVHPLGLVWLGVFLLIQLVMTTGLALAFAAVQAFIRDFEQFLSQALSVLFYLTPILYPISMVPSPFREVMDFNPLVHVIEPMRQALLFGTTPSWLNLAGMIVFAALTFWTGRKLFNRLSPHFEDVT